MINCGSAIAIFGLQDIPVTFETISKDFGINTLLISKESSKDVGRHLREIVSNTSALLIFGDENEIKTLIQLYLNANKKVYYIANEQNDKHFSKGIKAISKIEDAINELLDENEKVIIPSKIGNIEMRFNSFGLTFLKTCEDDNRTHSLNIKALYLKNQLHDYFEGKIQSFNIKVCLKGTEFQRLVWKELTNIPYGKTISYGDLATQLGDANASRAVGLANSKNPIWIIIPCHRVLGKDGDLTGYAGGLKLKQFLLDIESKQMSLF